MSISSVAVCASLSGFTFAIFLFSLQTATLVSMSSREVFACKAHSGEW